MLSPTEQRNSIVLVMLFLAGQQFLSTVGMSILASFFSSALGSQAGGAIVGLALAFAVGYSIQRSHPRLDGTGCWVGVLPAVGWIWELYDAITDQYTHRTAAQALASMFRNNGYDEGMGLAMSVAAGSAIAYSAGAYFAVHRARRVSLP